MTAQAPGSIDLLPVYGLNGVIYVPAWEVRALQRKANDEMLGCVGAALAGVGLDLFMRYPGTVLLLTLGGLALRDLLKAPKPGAPKPARKARPQPAPEAQAVPVIQCYH